MKTQWKEERGEKLDDARYKTYRLNMQSMEEIGPLLHFGPFPKNRHDGLCHLSFWKIQSWLLIQRYPGQILS